MCLFLKRPQTALHFSILRFPPFARYPIFVGVLTDRHTRLSLRASGAQADGARPLSAGRPAACVSASHRAVGDTRCCAHARGSGRHTCTGLWVTHTRCCAHAQGSGRHTHTAVHTHRALRTRTAVYMHGSLSVYPEASSVGGGRAHTHPPWDSHTASCNVTVRISTLFLSHMTASCKIRAGLKRGPKPNAAEPHGSREVQTIYSARKAAARSERGLKLLRHTWGGGGGAQQNEVAAGATGKGGAGGLAGPTQGPGEGKGTAIFTVSH